MDLQSVRELASLQSKYRVQPLRNLKNVPVPYRKTARKTLSPQAGVTVSPKKTVFKPPMRGPQLKSSCGSPRLAVAPATEITEQNSACENIGSAPQTNDTSNTTASDIRVTISPKETVCKQPLRSPQLKSSCESTRLVVAPATEITEQKSACENVGPAPQAKDTSNTTASDLMVSIMDEDDDNMVDGSPLGDQNWGNYKKVKPRPMPCWGKGLPRTPLSQILADFADVEEVYRQSQMDRRQWVAQYNRRGRGRGRSAIQKPSNKDWNLG